MTDATVYNALSVGQQYAEEIAAGRTPADPDAESLVEFWQATTRARSRSTVEAVGLVALAARGGYVTRRTSRSYRDAASGKIITEVVEDVAGPDWKAASWLLTHTTPEFAQGPQQVEVSGPGGGPVRVADVESLAGRVMAAVAARRAEEHGPFEIEGGRVEADGTIVMDAEVVEDGG
jgi:hypothetical protein